MPRDNENRYVIEREAEQRRDANRKRELAELRAAEVEAVGKALGFDDSELAEHLVDLGFDAERAPAFPLIPLVYVAWADGDVSTAERKQVLELAQKSGMKPDGPPFAFIADLLENRPRKDFFETSLKAIRRIHDSLPDELSQKAKTNLVSLCVGIAEASGGFMGLFGDKVCDDERKILEDIVSEFGLKGEAAGALFDK